LVLAVEPGVDPDEVATSVASRCDLPLRCIAVHQVEVLPRLLSGKPDYQAILALGAAGPATDVAVTSGATDDLREVYASVLGVAEVADDATFVTLGGDSLSYVEVSMKLEDTLGYVPPAWHVTPVGQLCALTPRRSTLRAVETGVVLRAVAIVMVVGSHMGLFGLWGGAHVLLAVAGYNFARFRLAAANAADHLRGALGSIGRILVPSVLFIGVLYLLSERYSAANVLLVNNYLADGTWRYWFWFIEALVHILVLLSLVFCLPAARRLERRHPFGLAFGILLATLALRQISMGDPANQIYRSHAVVWLFVLGWAAQRARTGWQRLAVSAVVVAAVPGFFDTTPRDALVMAGLLAVTWVPQLRVPSLLKPALGAVAGASLFIYLTHWQVYPPLLELTPPVVALVGTIAVGIAASIAFQRAFILLSNVRRRSGR
jgi:acyl carrier protein